MKKEIWMNICGFENYLVSDLGKIKRKKCTFVRSDGRIRKFNERLLGGNIHKGYHYVALQKTGESKKYQVHRLVAIAFIPNPNNYPCVNHKNGVPSDNRIENLEWCTYEQNNRHAREVLGIDVGKQHWKPIKCLDNGKMYKSAKSAAKELNISYNNICNVLKGRNKTTFGYKFIYS